MIGYHKLLLLSIILLGLSCGDDDNFVEPEINPVGACHYLFDQNGQSVGVLGECAGENHWVESRLLSREYDWLSFQDSIPFTNNFVQFANLFVSAYPIPALTNSQLFLYISGTAEPGQFSKFKATVIDAQENVIMNIAQTIEDGGNGFAISLEGLPAGQSYRIYYMFQDTALSIYHTGYGDFFICDDPFVNYNCL